MDIFLFPGDSPLTITPGDKTLHIHVSSNMDANPQNPPPTPPALTTPATEPETLMRVRPHRKWLIMIAVILPGALYIGLHSHPGRAPVSTPVFPQPQLGLLDPPEFPTRPVPRQQALAPQQPGAAPVQHAPSPLNQAFGLH